ncbi:MAG: hypothetical protein GXO65_06820 [Euryarchaeota archaeon]|nr:hypothetical protein [Euryarchaeota archaeon]
MQNFNLKMVKHEKRGRLGFKTSRDVSRIAREFIIEVLEFTTKNCMKHFQYTNRYTFFEGELPFHSVMCPAVSKVADSFIMEYPIKRKKNEKELIGRLDYYAHYRDIDILLELKLNTFNTYGKSSTRTEEDLQIAITQLKEISKSHINEIALNERKILIALVAIVFQDTMYDKDLETKDYIKNYLNLKSLNGNYQNLLRGSGISKRTLNKINFLGRWDLPINMLKQSKKRNIKTPVIYPQVVFIGNISEI